MNVLGLDTATPATVVALLRADGAAFEERHDPGAEQRPGHATKVLELVEAVLAGSGCSFADLDRIAVGTGPGSFTGLRIGVATARGLGQARGIEVVGVSTLEALAAPACAADPTRTVAAVLDARRGEVFAAAWRGARAPVLATMAAAPADAARALASLPAPRVAVGDGAVRFRAELHAAGAEIPPDGDPLHRVGAVALCRLAVNAAAGRDGAVLPEYGRLPDAERTRRAAEASDTP